MNRTRRFASIGFALALALTGCSANTAPSPNTLARTCVLSQSCNASTAIGGTVGQCTSFFQQGINSGQFAAFGIPSATRRASAATRPPEPHKTRPAPGAGRYTRPQKGSSSTPAGSPVPRRLRQAVMTKRKLPVCRAITITPAEQDLRCMPNRGRLEGAILGAPRSCSPVRPAPFVVQLTGATTWNSSRPLGCRRSPPSS